MLKHLVVTLAATLVATHANAFFLDGDGHYSLRGATETKPGFRSDSGSYQAIDQSFRLLGEVRLNDRASMFLEFRLFQNPRGSYLGDPVQPEECNEAKSTPGCKGAHQNSGEPGYQPYDPFVTEAFGRYAFDFCILEAGRRSRHWGLGIFMNSGKNPFDTSSTVYDGIGCNVNVQKSQTLGFSFGYDKLSETGTYIDPEFAASQQRKFGPNDPDDDIDQYYFSIIFDDRKSNAGSNFTKEIGVYFANVIAAKISDKDGVIKGGANTDLKLLDLYTGFYAGPVAIRNELFFRMGKSADPAWQIYGGAEDAESLPATNKLEAIGLAGDIEYTVARSGATVGPAEYNQGNASRHVALLQYAYAPGDADGYYDDLPSNSTVPEDQKASFNKTRRRPGGGNGSAKALAFSANYKPSLLLFRGHEELDYQRVDGVFNNSRVMNASVLGAGYRYESVEAGNFEAKIVTAVLNEGIPADMKQFYLDFAADYTERPIGYFGKNLGFELDLRYLYRIGKELELGVDIAAALPGDAWKVKENESPATNVLLQSTLGFKF
jgi:hypothetical protein